MHKRRPDSDRKRPLTHNQMNAQNWRYKKKTVPVDEFAALNGPVITRIPRSEPTTGKGTRTYPTYVPSTDPKHGPVSTLPHPFKCSKCAYVATGRPDFNDHWSLEH